MELAFLAAFIKTKAEKEYERKKKTRREGDREKDTQEVRDTQRHRNRQKLVEKGRRGHLPFISHLHNALS